MNREAHQRISEIFLEVCELEPRQRAARLSERCGEDAELRTAVEGLLHYDATHHEDPLSEAALRAGRQFGVDSAPATESPASTPPPERVGRYRILESIGTGGMGTVYLAEQDQPRRRVALKMIRSGALSRSLLRRFQFEADVLGRLQHPGIAQIYEAGQVDTAAGRQPYFAMEYVAGVELRQYARQHELRLRAILELLARICDAVHHAHQKGIIHRDLKPDNVLVVDEPAATTARGNLEFAGLGQPKVLDFGVARATNSDLQITTIQTNVGQLVGTVAYMSPEQVAGDSHMLDTRSDIYALGVILYELLAGRPPFELGHKTIPEAGRIIREEEPPRLSSIRALFRGDIDTIVTKALEKDPQRRYQSAAELAADIRRYLANEPIAAHPPSMFYQLRKLATRHTGLVLGLAAAFIVLVLGIISSTSFGLRAERGEKVARANEQRALLSETAARRSAYRLGLTSAAAVGEADPVQALRHLRDAPPEYRGWEWHHLRARFESQLAAYAGDHRTESVSAVARRPGGVLIAALERQDGIELVDLETGQVQGTFHEAGGLTTPNLSPDGRFLAARSSASGALTLWNTISGSKLPWFSVGCADARCARFSPDSTLLALNVPEGGAIIVALPGGQTGFSTVPACRKTQFLAFDPRGTRLAVTSVDACDGGYFYLKVYSTAGDLLASRMFIDGCEALEFSPDGALLAVGSFQRFVHLLDGSTLQTVRDLAGHSGKVTAITFALDGKLLASSSADGTTRLWDLATGELRRVFPGGNYAWLALTEDNTALAGGSTAEARLWDCTHGAQHVLRGHTSYVYDAAFSPDGMLLASCAWDDTVRIWDALSGEQLAALNADTPYGGVSFTPDGARVVALQWSGGQKLLSWDTATGLRLDSPRSTADEILFRADIPAAQLYARAAVAGAKQVSGVAPPGLNESSSRDGAFLAVPADESSSALHVVEMETGRVRTVLGQGRGPFTAVAFGRNSEQLITGSADGTVRLWDVTSGAELAARQEHVGSVYCVDLSPDGTRIASGGNDGNIILWDASALEPIATLRGHTSYVHCVSFGPDGTQLASASGDGTVRLWDSLLPQQRREQACLRQTLRSQAEPLVARYLEELGDPLAVADRLRRDAGLVEPLQQEALIALLKQSRSNDQNMSTSAGK